MDDHPQLAELIQAVLEEAGHAVTAVSGGRAALDRLAEQGYDLVVCDLQMPDVDGTAVYRAVEQLAPPRPAMLLMTGYDTEFVQTTQAAVLSKPVGIDELRDRVQRALEGV